MILHKALKKYGQNYLVDNNIIEKIINQFEINENDAVFEIGPGEGALTNKLIKLTKNLTVIEIDERKIEFLKEKFPTATILNGDFLKIDLHNIYKEQKVNIIGNIPYNLTSPILYKLVENRNNIKQAQLMVQYEVAKKITALQGSKDYGILNVILNYYSDIKICFKISPNVFFPKPKVYSAIIKLNFDKETKNVINDKLFVNLVKSSFGNRRKNLKNSLTNSIFANCDFSSAEHLMSKRAEELSVSDYLTLTQIAQEFYG